MVDSYCIHLKSEYRKPEQNSSVKSTDDLS